MQKSGKSHRKKSVKRARKTTPRDNIHGINFEPLETRQLLTTINVADYGARANDGQSDVGALQAALNASHDGDTIQFSGGVFDLPGGVTVSPNRTYQGTNGATLRGRSSDGQLMTVHGDNVTVTGLTFDGGGFFVDKPGGGGFNQNIVLDYNTFKLNTSGVNSNGITFTCGLQNSKITNNYFTGYTGGFGIYGYNYNGLTIANNELVNVQAGMHIDAFGGSGNLLVEQNYITGAKAMGMEFQGTASGLVFQDNWFEHPNLTTTASQNTSSMAFSLILDKSSNITVRRNTVIAPERPDGRGCRVGFEIGGDNTLVEDNYINGIDELVGVNDGAGSCSVTVRNNKFMNALDGIYLAFPAFNRTLTQYNNGPDVTLTWDINRAKPGIGDKRYGGQASTPPPVTNQTPPPAPTPDPAPVVTTPVVTTPVVTIPTGPTGLAAIVTGATTVELFWSDKSDNETGYKVESSTDGGQSWRTIKTLGADVVGYSATGLTTGQEYNFRVCANNSAGNSSYSNVATVTPAAPDPSLGTFVSDLVPTSATNHWGPYERDMSNGEEAAGDGQIMTIAGQTFDKGLGVHSGSELHFNLGGNYGSFLSDVGIDDETNGLGSVEFQVWADGVMLYSSGVMQSADGHKSINVDVTGKSELVLKVTDGGDGFFFDHADWANARLTAATPAAAGPVIDSVPASVPNFVYVSDLQWASQRNGYGPFELDHSNGEQAANDGGTITLNGQTYSKGLGVHATSDIRYALDGKYATFTADVGIDDEVGNRGSVVFQVWADGTKLFDSGTVTGSSATRSVNVNVQGKQQLWLIVTSAGKGRFFDHADWADAKLTLSATPASVTATNLGDLIPTDVTNGWGPIELNRSVGEQGANDGGTMSVNGMSYSTGVGVHSDSKLVYNLNGQYTTFTTDLGIDDEVGNRGSVDFEIWADGHKVYDSGLVTGASTIRHATVNVSGVNQIWLIVTSGGDGYEFDHADWAGARLTA